MEEGDVAVDSVVVSRKRANTTLVFDTELVFTHPDDVNAFYELSAISHWVLRILWWLLAWQDLLVVRSELLCGGLVCSRSHFE